MDEGERLRHKVLLVDDDAAPLEALTTILEGEGFSVVRARSAVEGFAAALDSQPDVVVSDVMMPGISGQAFAAQLRGDLRTAGIPILLLSAAKTSVDSQTDGINAGADDYLIKPCAPRLLVSKIKAAVRRGTQRALERAARAGIEIDAPGRRVRVAGRAVELTRKEFDLLTALVMRAGAALSIPYLLETVWGVDPAYSNDPSTVRVHVGNLRRKLGEDAARRIITLSGHGYRFDA